jgi:PAB1-binding protein PBP1
LKFVRGWDQFETNKTLFGVKSTFNEELYTTKLEKGPRTRELDLRALRIAREIEGEETRDLHLAEVCVALIPFFSHSLQLVSFSSFFI